MKISSFLLLMGLFSQSLLAESTSNLKDGVMIYGYDPVSYFDGKPQKGLKELSAEHAGLKYLFKSEENRARFQKKPEQYVPAYEGWCATAVAKGYKYDIDPEIYLIADGRLLLFYKGWLGDARKDWLKDPKANLALADQLWPKVKTSKE